MTADEQFRVVVEELDKPTWQSEATQFAVLTLFRALGKELPAYLGERLAKVPSAAIPRLHAYVRSFPLFIAARRTRAVDAVLAQLAALDPPRFTFDRLQVYTIDQLAKLSAAASQQLLITAGHYVGRSQAFASLAGFRRHIGNDVEPRTERWRVWEHGKPVYVLWLLFKNSGTVFKARESTPLLDVQHGTIEGRGAPLAEALQQCAPFLKLTTMRV